jgi:hypothetical protein
MEKIKFTEKFKKEDWEPLYGKWFYETIEKVGCTFDYWTIYKVTKTELGFTVYRLISNGVESESFATYNDAYRVSEMPCDVRLFVDSFASGQLRPLDESKVGDVKNLIAEVKAADKSYEDAQVTLRDSRKNIFERFLSLVQ